MGVPKTGMKFGNAYNYWLKTEDGWDLTRGGSNKKLIKTTKDEISIAPERSALVIIDMQNFFLHERLMDIGLGRDSIPALMETVKACRESGMPVVWCNMGFHKGDLMTVPPSYLVSSYKSNNAVFGESIGTVDDMDMGPKLMKDSWNAKLWGPLQAFAEEGIKAGTDHWVWKNRYSALCGNQPLALWLEENQITTTMWAGVATDVCVWGSLMDAYYKGYDVILINDLAQTKAPEHQTQTAIYNAERYGWVTESKDILAGLQGGKPAVNSAH